MQNNLITPSTDPQLAALESVCDHRYARIVALVTLAGLSHEEAERRAADVVARYLRTWIAKHANETNAHPDHQRRMDHRRKFAEALLEGYAP